MLAWLHQLDLQILFGLNALVGHSAVLDWAIYALAVYLAPVLVLVFVVLLFYSPVSIHEKGRILLTVFIAELISRIGFLNGIQIFYDRPRPFLVFADKIHSLFTVNAYAFPSGHATFFFTLAFVVLFYNRKWGIWFLTATLLMTTARVAAGVHYPSDILGGAVIGFIVALLVYAVSSRLARGR